MLDALKVQNFNPHSELELVDHSAVVIKTCQRILVISYDEYNPVDEALVGQETYRHINAYRFLLEIICGLQSKMLGENEIVGQFKEAYKDYVQNQNKNPNLITILEKLFKDAKEIRTKHLLGLCQKTYAGIARKQLVNKNNADEVLILGSGVLAEDLINQLKKKAVVYISARNSSKVNELANQHDLKIIPWKNIHLYQDFPFIANTIGFEGTLLDESFLKKWTQNHEDRLLIDLGSPTAIKSDIGLENGLMRLENILDEGAIHENHKLNQIKKAHQAIAQAVEKRYIHLKEKKLMRMKYDGRQQLQKTI